MPAKKIKITVTAKRPSFRRCGRKWTDAPSEVEMDSSLVAILKSEPMLIVFDGWLSKPPTQVAAGNAPEDKGA